MPEMTVAEWAKTMNISRQQGYEAVTRCGIPVTNKKLDSDVATMLYSKHTRPRANGRRSEEGAETEAALAPTGAPTPAPKVPGYDTSRAKREAAEAEMAQMRLAEMAGQLVKRSEVDAAVFAAARALRDSMHNCSRRIAAEVAGLPAAECEVIIDREHRALLEDMAQVLAAQLGPAADPAEGRGAGE